MAAPFFALANGEPLMQDTANSRVHRVGKIAVSFCLIGLSCTAVWMIKEQVSVADSSTFLAVMPKIAHSIVPAPSMNFRQTEPVSIICQKGQFPSRSRVTCKRGIPAYRRRWKQAGKIRGDAERPRLSVMKSGQHIYAQLVDDTIPSRPQTLAFVSTRSKEMRDAGFGKKNREAARAVGERIAEVARTKGILEAVYDRGGWKYEGIIADIAEGARSKGLLDKENPNRVPLGEEGAAKTEEEPVAA